MISWTQSPEGAALRKVISETCQDMQASLNKWLSCCQSVGANSEIELRASCMYYHFCAYHPPNFRLQPPITYYHRHSYPVKCRFFQTQAERNRGLRKVWHPLLNVPTIHLVLRPHFHLFYDRLAPSRDPHIAGSVHVPNQSPLGNPLLIFKHHPLSYPIPQSASFRPHLQEMARIAAVEPSRKSHLTDHHHPPFPSSQDLLLPLYLLSFVRDLERNRKETFSVVKTLRS